MPGIDLTNARVRVTERVLVDRVSFRRNPVTRQGVTIDDTTGAATPNPDADATVLAADVPAAAREVARLEQRYGETVEKVWEVSTDYTLTPTDLAVGDSITFDVSADLELLGKTLFVQRVITGTLRVTRKVEATRKFDGIGQH